MSPTMRTLIRQTQRNNYSNQNHSEITRQLRLNGLDRDDELMRSLRESGVLP
jgi:hypothetical protein